MAASKTAAAPERLVLQIHVLSTWWFVSETSHSHSAASLLLMNPICIRLQCLAQGHFNMETVGAGDQTINLRGRPTLPPKPHQINSFHWVRLSSCMSVNLLDPWLYFEVLWSDFLPLPWFGYIKYMFIYKAPFKTKVTRCCTKQILR